MVEAFFANAVVRTFPGDRTGPGRRSAPTVDAVGTVDAVDAVDAVAHGWRVVDQGGLPAARPASPMRADGRRARCPRRRPQPVAAAAASTDTVMTPGTDSTRACATARSDASW